MSYLFQGYPGMSFVDLNRKRVSNSLYLVNNDTISIQIEDLDVR